METMSIHIENVKDVKLSENTKKILIALANFEESFYYICDLLTEKSEDEKVQEVYTAMAEKEQEKAIGYYCDTFKEIETLAKNKMFQVFFDSEFKEI